MYTGSTLSHDHASLPSCTHSAQSRTLFLNAVPPLMLLPPPTTLACATCIESLPSGSSTRMFQSMRSLKISDCPFMGTRRAFFAPNATSGSRQSGPASRRSTLNAAFSAIRAAMMQPAEPAPTTMCVNGAIFDSRTSSLLAQPAVCLVRVTMCKCNV